MWFGGKGPERRVGHAVNRPVPLPPWGCVPSRAQPSCVATGVSEDACDFPCVFVVILGLWRDLATQDVD